MNKSLLALLLVVATFGCLAIVDVLGLKVFSLILGQNVKVLVVGYSVIPVYYAGEIVSLNFDWTWRVQNLKIPIENIMLNTETRAVEPESFESGQIFSLRLIIAMTVENNKNIFFKEFSFNNADAREITIYLHFYKQNYGSLNVNVHGSYILNDQNQDFTVGKTFDQI